jgi:UDPglucose--hexose-1-phosphate uridylyltransferase
MAAYRKDPLVERWVIIAPDRAGRPHEFVETESVRRGGLCPFCAGSESETTPEIDAVREAGTAKNGPGWRVRAVGNKFPFLDKAEGGAGKGEVPSGGPLRFLSNQAVGKHEVLIESPTHVTRSGELSVEQLTDVLRLYRSRLAELRRESGIRYVQIFKNVGEAGGASIEHLHSQLAALTIVPAAVAEEHAASLAYHAEQGRCAYCDLIAAELAAEVRIVEQTPSYVVACPYASRFSYEMQLLPRRHAADFDGLSDADLGELAAVLRRTLLRVESFGARPAYNVVLHTDSFDSFGPEHYHWHMEVLPRGSKQAGFEWATGVFVNAVAPEAAATALRRALGTLEGDDSPWGTAPAAGEAGDCKTGVTRRGEFAD